MARSGQNKSSKVADVAQRLKISETVADALYRSLINIEMRVSPVMTFDQIRRNASDKMAFLVRMYEQQEEGRRKRADSTSKK